MKIGILSDTHGAQGVIDDVINHKEAAGIEHWLFAGDIAIDAEYLEVLSDTKVTAVAGNNDYFGSGLKDIEVINLAGHKFFLTHGHMHNVQWGHRDLIAAAKFANADIAVYGHTHVAVMEKEDILVLNPGSAARPRDNHKGSFMVVNITPNEPINVKIVRL